MTEKAKKDNLEVLDEHRMGTFARIYNIFFLPTNTLKSINQKPNWLLPLLLVLVVVLVFQILATPIKINNAKEKIRNNPNLTPEQVERGLDNIEQFTEDSAFHTKMALSLGIFAGAEVVKLFAVAFVFMFANQIGAGGGSFKKILSVASYVNLVSIVEMAIKLPLVLVKKTLNVYTSLAVILPLEYQNSLLHRLLNTINVFALWRIILFSIGLTAVTQLSFKKSTFLVIYVWIGWIIVYTLLGNMVRIQ